MSLARILNWIGSQPLWLPIAAAALVLAIIVVILWILIARGAFRRRLKALYEHTENLESFVLRYSREQLIRRSGLIEKVARRYGMQIVPLIVADDIDLSPEKPETPR